MRFTLIALFGLLFLSAGIAESTHAHQFLQDDCCSSMCPGSVAAVRGTDTVRRLEVPDLTRAELVVETPFFVFGIFAEDIFHPPLA